MHRFMTTNSMCTKKWKCSDRANWLLFVAFYAIFVNVPLWVANHCFGLLPIGWFCVDYAAVGLFALFVPQIVATVLLMLVIVADLTSAVSKTYYLSPSECLANIGSLSELHGTRLLSMVAIAALILLVTSISALFPLASMGKVNRSRVTVCLIAFMTIAVSIDSVTVMGETKHLPGLFWTADKGDQVKLNYLTKTWISRYPLIRLVRFEKAMNFSFDSITDATADYSPAPSATAAAIKASGLTADRSVQDMPNLVVVLVESWGFDMDPLVRNSLVRSYSQSNLLAHYEVLQGSVPFYGSTVAGEARELCGNRLGFNILKIPAQKSLNCLPDRFVSQGYHSLAVHGMDGHMFNRFIWYSRIGFQEQWFWNRFRQDGLPNCYGAFLGTCDAAIADWIGHRLEKKEVNPEFVYWVTLNSHLPVPVPSALPNGASCSLSPSLAKAALCSWYQLIFNVHDSISELAMTKLARPTVFVVVGDHAPPFANPTLRGQFSSTEVPYVLLVPRQQTGLAAISGN
jgi:phosphoglycerol transferase MdoB-like AlkP superfamily enzyme